MSSPFSPTGSIDQQAPALDKSPLFKTWALSEIYDGTIGQNHWVPKVGDTVRDIATRREWVVESVPELTLIAVLIEITGGADGTDFTSTGPETWQVYVDDSVVPHILAVDQRYRIAGSGSTYAKIFRGTTDGGSTGKIISWLYDQAGNELGNALPLELASTNSHDETEKVVGVGYTKEPIANGELVSVVCYNAQGHVTAIQPMRVKNTSFIRDVGASTRHITDISLESPFLSSSDPQTLDYPLNVPLQGANMTGVVHYSDGSEARYPVDGTRFAMLGLERFVATTPGPRIPLVLRYQLQTGEVSYDLTSVDNRMKSKPYSLVAIPQQGHYSVKLFCYPQWVDANAGYTLRWYMMNLDRDIFFEVTPFVFFNSNAPVFNSLGYNMNQMVSVRINLRDVSMAFPAYIHTQVLSVQLKAPATDPGLHWLVSQDATSNTWYGDLTRARVTMVNSNLWRVNLASGQTTIGDWLEKVYYETRPVYSTLNELKAPTPTHFVVINGSTRVTYPIEQWSQDLAFSSALPTAGTLTVEFQKVVSVTETLRLGVAGFDIVQV